MPKKPRIRKFDGPLKNIPKPEPSPQSQSNTDGQEDSSGSQEYSMEAKFERELTWCVDQLELGLETQNPDSRQAIEAIKVLKILKSDKAPMIKKRQVMRNTFGDYRQKMMSEEKRSAAKARKLAFAAGSDSGKDSKSTFYRKSKSSQTERNMNSNETDASAAKSVKRDCDVVAQSGNTDIYGASPSCGTLKSDDSGFKFSSSDGDFKFDFNLSLDDPVPANDLQTACHKEIDDVKETDHSEIDKSQSEAVKQDISHTSGSKVDEGLADYFKKSRKDNSFLFNFSIPD